MNRVPRAFVLILVPTVIGVTWWRGTRDYDFLDPPTATEIETARSRVTSELARPGDLFAIERTSPDATPRPEPAPMPAPAPAPAPKPPRIDVSDPTSPPPTDAWIERADLPAGSFIELASRLEANAHLAWARVTWERVIDHADAGREDVEVAVRAIARIRASAPPPDEFPDGAPVVRLRVRAPADRVELTRRAAREAAVALEQAADRAIRFTPEVTPDRSDDAPLWVALIPPGAEDGEPSSVSSAPPADPNLIRRNILEAAFKLIASALSTSDSLAPVPPPLEGEPPGEALANRITRRAWAAYVADPEGNR